MASNQGKVQAKNTRAEAIQKAQAKKWPGITDVFEPHEIAWLVNYSNRTGYFSCRPYPCVHGRLRLVHEDHPDGGLSITTAHEFFSDKGVIVIATATTRKGTFTGRKAGKLDPGGDVTLEKIETGAVGRALMYAGYGVGAPSAEETSLWQHQQDEAAAANGKDNKPEGSKGKDNGNQPPNAGTGTIGDIKNEIMTVEKRIRETTEISTADVRDQHLGDQSLGHPKAKLQEYLSLLMADYADVIGDEVPDDMG